MDSYVLTLPAAAEMQQRLQKILPRFAQIRWVEQTGSTNPDLMTQARQPQGRLLKPWLLGAHHQTQGQGRSGRPWANAPGTQLMFSCAFDVFIPGYRLPTLSVITGLGACLGLRSLFPAAEQQPLTLKWPNDLMWGHAKLAGILTQVTRANTSQWAKDHYVVVVGIGINLTRAQKLSQQFQRAIADWEQVCQTLPELCRHEPEHLVACIAHRWWQQLNEVSTRGVDALLEQYAEVDYLRQLPVNIIDEGVVRHQGVAAGINEQGQLLIQSGAETQAISVGEVSVRLQAGDDYS